MSERRGIHLLSFCLRVLLRLMKLHQRAIMLSLPYRVYGSECEDEQRSRYGIMLIGESLEDGASREIGDDEKVFMMLYVLYYIVTISIQTSSPFLRKQGETRHPITTFHGLQKVSSPCKSDKRKQNAAKCRQKLSEKRQFQISPSNSLAIAVRSCSH